MPTLPTFSSAGARRHGLRAGLALLLTLLMVLGALPHAFAGGVSSLQFRGSGPKAVKGRPAPAPAPAPAPTPTRPTVTPLSIGLPLNYAEVDQATLEARLDDARAAGVTTVHGGAVWWYLCRTTTCDWSGLDRFVAAANARGLSVTLQVTGVPDWVHPDLAGLPADQRRWTLPRNDAERRQFEAFTAELAGRYRGRVARYEIWNEPNLPEFAQPVPSPSGFARTLAAGYRGVKSADPAALVVSGGLSRSDVGFASATLRELAALPGADRNRLFFDEFGVHPYSDEQSPEATVAAKVFTGAYGTVDNNFSGVDRITALLDSHGRSDAKVYIGEYGFSTTDTWMSAVPDWRRGYYAALALQRMRGNPRVSALVWYAYLPHSATGPEWSTMAVNGAPSATFRSIAAANTRSLERAWPAVPAAVTELWTMHASTFGVTAVGRTEVFVDGHLLASSGSDAITVNTRAASNGSHQVRVVWYDAQGAVIGFTAPTAISFQNSTDRSLTSTPVQIARLSDGTYQAQSTLTVSPALQVDFATVAVRDSAGRNLDFPGIHGFAVSGDGSSLRLQRALPPGNYRAFVAVLRDGTWTAMPGEAVFVVP